MRISFFSFTQDADLLVTPPSRVRYTLPFINRQEVTSTRTVRLRRLAHRNGKNITYSWDAIPEKELALLTLIPPDEVHTLITESGKELQVVFGEPEREVTQYMTYDGQLTYSVNLPVFQVNQETLSEVVPKSPPSYRLLSIAYDLTQAAHKWPPQVVTPAYTPVLPRASAGLPPGVDYGEANRFTFKTYNHDTALRYFSEDRDGFFETGDFTPLYGDWYSPHKGNKVADAELRRTYFQPDQAWSVGMLLWRTTLTDGSVLSASYNNNNLSIATQGMTLNITFKTLSGVTYNKSLTLSGGYDYLWLQYSYGKLSYGFNADTGVISPEVGQPESALEGCWIGGGSMYIDDLVLSNRDTLDMPAIKAWLLEE